MKLAVYIKNKGSKPVFKSSVRCLFIYGPYTSRSFHTSHLFSELYCFIPQSSEKQNFLYTIFTFSENSKFSPLCTVSSTNIKLLVKTDDTVIDI